MNQKKFILIGAAIVILAVIVYIFLHKSDQFTNYPPKNQTVVAFGDSLVEGVGATSGNDLFSYVGRNLNIQIINKGKSGDTTGSALSRVDDVLALDPGIVIVLLGGNDVLRGVPKAETFQNLETIIQKLQKSGALVVLLGVRGGILSDVYESDFANLAEKYHAPYVSNVLKNIILNKDYMYDTIHPNDKGYAIIAERVSTVLKGVLK